LSTRSLFSYLFAPAVVLPIVHIIQVAHLSFNWHQIKERHKFWVTGRHGLLSLAVFFCARWRDGRRYIFARMNRRNDFFIAFSTTTRGREELVDADETTDCCWQDNYILPVVRVLLHYNSH
jgi:hypothetical protein